MQVGGTFNKNAKKIEGNALFLLDFKAAPPSFLLDIEGAFYIPGIMTYATVDIGINSLGAKLEGEISFLNGLLKPYAKLEWKWDMSYFKGEFGNIIFGAGVLEIKELFIESRIQPNNDFYFKFRTK